MTFAVIYRSHGKVRILKKKKKKIRLQTCVCAQKISLPLSAIRLTFSPPPPPYQTEPCSIQAFEITDAWLHSSAEMSAVQPLRFPTPAPALEELTAAWCVLPAGGWHWLACRRWERQTLFFFFFSFFFQDRCPAVFCWPVDLGCC